MSLGNERRVVSVLLKSHDTAGSAQVVEKMKARYGWHQIVESHRALLCGSDGNGAVQVCDGSLEGIARHGRHIHLDVCREQSAETFHQGSGQRFIESCVQGIGERRGTARFSLPASCRDAPLFVDLPGSCSGFDSGGLGPSCTWPVAFLQPANRNRRAVADLLKLRMHLAHFERRSRAVTHNATLAEWGGVRKRMRRDSLGYVAADTSR